MTWLFQTRSLIRTCCWRPESTEDLLQQLEVSSLLSPQQPSCLQAGGIAALPRKIHRRRKSATPDAVHRDGPRIRLQAWQRVRTWARLIREAEQLWHVDVRELKRLGALELSQILGEIPPAHRQRVNRWLKGYAAATRLHSQEEQGDKHHPSRRQ